jgi:hypothetical protein
MTDVGESPAAADGPSTDATEALVERIFTATIESLEIASIHLGSTLGFYRALAGGGDATPGELAARTPTTERVADRFAAPGDQLERLNYGWSVLHCLTVGMLDGTVIRADTVRAYASDAGFRRVDVLPIEHEFWRFYRLVP